MTTLTIDVRPAEPADAVEIAEVHRAAWSQAYTGIIPFRSLRAMIERRGARWWGRAIRGSTSILVLDVGGTIAGYATLGLNRARALPQEGEIYELYLLPEYQGVGLGRRLFDEARRFLRLARLQGTCRLVPRGKRQRPRLLPRRAAAGTSPRGPRLSTASA